MKQPSGKRSLPQRLALTPAHPYSTPNIEQTGMSIDRGKIRRSLAERLEEKALRRSQQEVWDMDTWRQSA